jgi:hypothetical protein
VRVIQHEKSQALHSFVVAEGAKQAFVTLNAKGEIHSAEAVGCFDSNETWFFVQEVLTAIKIELASTS